MSDTGGFGSDFGTLTCLNCPELILRAASLCYSRGASQALNYLLISRVGLSSGKGARFLRYFVCIWMILSLSKGPVQEQLFLGSIDRLNGL